MDSISYIHRRGVGIYMDGDTLRAYPASRLDPNLRNFIRDHRDQIVAVLQGELVIEITVGNIVALSPEELEEYERELTTAPEDRPHIDHDREAWRRAQAVLLQRTKEAA